MKEMFKKLFAGNPAQPSASAEQQEEVVDMTTQTEATALAAETKIAELSASLATATDAIAAQEAKFAEMQSQLDKANASMAAVEAEKAQLAADAKAKVTATRSEKLVAKLGTEKAPAVLAALENLDDATFETVLGTYAANYEAEAKSAMFTEAGVGGEVKAEAVQDTAARLKASLDAQFKTK